MVSRFIRFINDELEKIWESLGLTVSVLLEGLQKTRKFSAQQMSRQRLEPRVSRTKV
jgi:hypothetical protein